MCIGESNLMMIIHEHHTKGTQGEGGHTFSAGHIGILFERLERRPVSVTSEKLREVDFTHGVVHGLSSFLLDRR